MIINYKSALNKGFLFDFEFSIKNIILSIKTQINLA